MKHILAPAHREVLATLARKRALLAFDFDGTLAPIVPDRKAARMRSETRRLLARVCAVYPCAVISGRRRADIERRLNGVRPRYVVGNHGLEPGTGLNEFARVIAAARVRLARVLAGWPGVELEEKRYSLAVHYRRSMHSAKTRAAIHAAIAALPQPLRIVGGKLVVNAIPDPAPDKGDALQRLCVRAAADAALFIGDDVTDEDAFTLPSAALPRLLLTIRVGRSRGSAARYYLRDQAEIDDLLALLIALRAAESAR